MMVVWDGCDTRPWRPNPVMNNVWNKLESNQTGWVLLSDGQFSTTMVSEIQASKLWGPGEEAAPSPRRPA